MNPEFDGVASMNNAKRSQIGVESIDSRPPRVIKATAKSRAIVKANMQRRPRQIGAPPTKKKRPQRKQRAKSAPPVTEPGGQQQPQNAPAQS